MDNNKAIVMQWSQIIRTSTGVTTALAELPADAHIDIDALARMLNRCTKSVQRAVRRGELPAPIRFMGKRVWMVGAILKHMRARQETALKEASRREARIERHAI